MRPVRFFVEHPTASNLLMIAMLAIGIVSLGGLRRETLPDALPVEVEVSVVYPGASSGEIEEAIVRRMEESLSGVPYLKEMRSVARENVGMTTLRMMDAGDYARFRSEIENAVGSIEDFPAGSRPPIFTPLAATRTLPSYFGVVQHFPRLVNSLAIVMCEQQ